MKINYILFICIFLFSYCEMEKQKSVKAKNEISKDKQDENGYPVEVKNIQITVIDGHQYIKFFEKTFFYNPKGAEFELQYPVYVHRPDCFKCHPKKVNKNGK